MTDADKIMNPKHFGSYPADRRIWINPEIWIRIPDHIWMRLDTLAEVDCNLVIRHIVIVIIVIVSKESELALCSENAAEEISSFIERRTSRAQRSSAQPQAVRVQGQISRTLQGISATMLKCENQGRGRNVRDQTPIVRINMGTSKLMLKTWRPALYTQALTKTKLCYTHNFIRHQRQQQ